MRLLLVEDDRNLGLATAEGLREVHAVDWVHSAEDAQDAMATCDYALVILDISLPGMSGLEFLQQLRQRKVQVPILLMTARNTTAQIVEGLNTGADDYLAKPFDFGELLARCAALVRRSSGHAEPVITIKDLSYEPATGKLLKNHTNVLLSARERSVFDCLIRNIDRPVSKNDIVANIYDWSSENIESNTIEVHVAALRRKLGKELIETIRGVGYIIRR